MRAIYHKGASPDLEVTWEADGELVDLTGVDIGTITITAFKFGGETIFTKTTGLQAQAPVDDAVPDPNLIVVWGNELDALSAGTYILKFETQAGHEMFGQLVMRENAPNFGYCEISDLKLGDVTVADENLYDYVNTAADEMNAELGQLYTLPLDLSAAPPFVHLKLKKINAHLASGQFIAARAIPAENEGLQAYAKWLIDTAYEELREIMTGLVELTGVPRAEGTFRSTAPLIINHDSSSPVDAFEQFVMRGEPAAPWVPGR